MMVNLKKQRNKRQEESKDQLKKMIYNIAPIQNYKIKKLLIKLKMKSVRTKMNNRFIQRQVHIISLKRSKQNKIIDNSKAKLKEVDCTFKMNFKIFSNKK